MNNATKIMLFSAFSALLTASGCALKTSASKPDAADTVVIDKNARSPFNNGVFQGWGTSFCWWANRTGYSDELAERTAELFYSLNGDGLGLNIIRYNIGGGDDPSHHHITRTDSAVPGFLSPDGTYDWSQDANQRNCLLRAVKKAGDSIIVEAFSNSAPWFMTVSGCSSGHTNPGMDNLRPDQYEAFADYLATVTKHYQTEWNVRFQSLSPMNEPNTRYWGANSPKQEGCHFDPGESQSKMIIETRKALDRQGLTDVLVCGTDETSTETAAKSLAALSEEALAALGRVDTHSYNYPKDYRTESYAVIHNAAVDANKNLWMSEVDKGGTAGTDAGEMGAPLELALRIINDMNGLKPSAWCIWDIIDSHISADGYNGNKDNGKPDTQKGYWGIATADHDSQTILLWKKYYGFAQFTRYIRPGYKLLPLAKHNVLAALSGDEKELVVVIANTEAVARTFAVDTKSFGSKLALKTVIRTSGSLAEGENLAELPCDMPRSGRVFYPEAAANSITTCIFRSGK